MLPELPGVVHHQVPVPGVELHVAEAGPADGPAVVLLHGWPQHWWMWRAPLQALAAAGHRVLAPDLRGFGWSSVPAEGYDKQQLADDVLAALDALGVGRFAVAGHDWGGWVAQLVALGAPDRVTRLAVLNMAPLSSGPREALPRLWRFSYMLPLITPGVDVAVQRSALLRRALIGVPQDDAERYAERLRDPRRARAAGQVYRTFVLREVPARLRDGGSSAPRLGLPVLVLHGDQDPVIRPALVARFADLADDLEVRTLPGVGHFVVDEEPELVAEALVGWAAADR